MKNIIIAALTLVSATAVFAGESPAFYAKAQAASGIGVVSHDIPKTYGPGAFETKMSVFNGRDAALRGELKVVLETNTISSASIDLPPSGNSDAVQTLIAKGEIPADAKGKSIKVVLSANGAETVCYAGKIAEKTVLAPEAPPVLPKITKQAQALGKEGICCLGTSYSYGQRKDWVFADRKQTVSGVKINAKIVNVNQASTNLNIALQMTVTDKTGTPRTYLARRISGKIGEEFSLGTGADSIGLNGKCHVVCEILIWDTDKRYVISETDVNFPERIEIVPPWFRDGIVSTCRKTATIRVGLKINCCSASRVDRTWKIVAKNKDGQEAATAEGICAADATEIAVDLPFAKDAPAGEYSLEAVLIDGEIKDTANDSLKIVAPEPGQMIVDQDGYFLNEGKPFLPLGTYHCHAWTLTNVVDEATGLRAMDMGFNWMQMWGWDYDMNVSVDREFLERRYKGDIDKLETDAEKKAFVDAKIKANGATRKILNDMGVVLCYEGFDCWGQIINGPGPDGKYPFEKNENMPRDVKRMGEEPDHLVRMYYLADEAGGNYYSQLKRATKILRENDPGIHPSFSLGNFAAIMSGDCGGIDAYRRYYGGLGGPLGMIDALESSAQGLAPYQLRPFAVPQAFGQSPRQWSETPEYVRIQAYLSLIHGASGLGFYCWQQTGDWNGSQRQGMGWNPPTAHEVKKIIAEVKVFANAIMAPGAKQYRSADDNVHAILCGNDETGRFLVCANAYELPVKTTLAIPGLEKFELEPLFGAPKAKLSGLGKKDEFAMELTGFGTAVWKIK